MTVSPAMLEPVEADTGDDCPMVLLLDLLSGKWSLPVLYRLIRADGPLRFTELQRMIPGITQKDLTRHLRQFEALGVVDRQAFRGVPPRVEYRITRFGRSLKEPLDSLAHWADSNREAITARELGHSTVS